MQTIIPKQPTVYPKWTGIVLVVSSLLLVAAGLSLFAFWLLALRTTDSIAALDVNLNREQSQEETDLEARVLGYKKKLDDFVTIAERRRYPDNFFSFIESVTHKDLFFMSLSLNAADNKATLSGEAKDFRVLAEQIVILKSAEKLDYFTIDSIKLGEEGSVSFSLSLVVAEDFFTTPPPSSEQPEEQQSS